MNALCHFYNFEPGSVARGYFSDWDFSIQLSENRIITFELKISASGTTNGSIELARADGRASGLTATKSDYYIFLNSAGNIGKLRIIPTKELKTFYKSPKNTFTTQTNGDKIGSLLAPLNFKNFNDIMILECDYNSNKQEFNTDTFKPNSYAKRMIHNYIR